jgi:hypothetical protein
MSKTARSGFNSPRVGIQCVVPDGEDWPRNRTARPINANEMARSTTPRQKNLGSRGVGIDLTKIRSAIAGEGERELEWKC